MSSEQEPPTAQTWLDGRGRRRVGAVSQAYGMLGLDHGKGHLDDLYAAAYDHAFRDAWALAAQMMQDRFSDSLPGHLWLGHVALHEQARQAEEPG